MEGQKQGNLGTSEQLCTEVLGGDGEVCLREGVGAELDGEFSTQRGLVEERGLGHAGWNVPR